MSMLEEFKTFAEVPKNVQTQLQWLSKKLSVLEKRIESPPARGQGEATEAPTTYTVGPVNLNEYPEMGNVGRYTKLKAHFHTLGGEPTREDCLKILEGFKDDVFGNDKVAARFKIPKAHAIAWTYILKKRGWLKWSDNPKGLVITEAAPLNGHYRKV